MNTRSANQVQRLLLINNLLGSASKPFPEDLIPTLMEFTGITVKDARKRRNKLASKTPAQCLREYTFARYKITRSESIGGEAGGRAASSSFRPTGRATTTS